MKIQLTKKNLQDVLVRDVWLHRLQPRPHPCADAGLKVYQRADDVECQCVEFIQRHDHLIGDLQPVVRDRECRRAQISGFGLEASRAVSHANDSAEMWVLPVDDLQRRKFQAW